MNSKLFIAIVVLACLVAEARCGLLDGILSSKKSMADFDDLESLLVANVDSSQLADNLKYIKDNIETFEDERVKTAAELVMKVSELKPPRMKTVPVDTCDPQVLSVLNELTQNNLDIVGVRRFERSINSTALSMARYWCLNEAIKSIWKLNQDYYQFFKYFGPNSNDEIFDELRKKVENIEGERFKYLFRDERTGEVYTAKVAKRFESAIQKYVMRPCKKFLADDRLNLLVDRYTTLKAFGDNNWREIDSTGYSKLAQTKEKCYEFLTMDRAARAKLFQSISGRELEL